MSDPTLLAAKIREFYGQEIFDHYEELMSSCETLDEAAPRGAGRRAPRALGKSTRSAAGRLSSRTGVYSPRERAVSRTYGRKTGTKFQDLDKNLSRDVKREKGLNRADKARADRLKAGAAKRRKAGLGRYGTNKATAPLDKNPDSGSNAAAGRGKKTSQPLSAMIKSSGVTSYSPQDWHDLIKRAARGEDGTLKGLATPFAQYINKQARGRGVKGDKFVDWNHGAKDDLRWATPTGQKRGGDYEQFKSGGSKTPMSEAQKYLEKYGGRTDEGGIHEFIGFLKRRYTWAIGNFASRVKQIKTSSISKVGPTGKEFDVVGDKSKQTSSEEERDMLKAIGSKMLQAFNDMSSKGEFGSKSDYGGGRKAADPELTNKLNTTAAREQFFDSKGKVIWKELRADPKNPDGEGKPLRPRRAAIGAVSKLMGDGTYGERVMAKLGSDADSIKSGKPTGAANSLVNSISKSLNDIVLPKMKKWLIDNLSKRDKIAIRDLMKSKGVKKVDGLPKDGDDESGAAYDTKSLHHKISRGVDKRDAREAKRKAAGKIERVKESVDYDDNVSLLEFMSNVYGVDPIFMTEDMACNLFFSCMSDLTEVYHD